MRKETYLKCILTGYPVKPDMEGIEYHVEVTDESTPLPENDIFVEAIFISGGACSIRYGKRYPNPEEIDLADMTFAKAKARIALGFFEKSNLYRIVYGINDIQRTPAETDEDSIRRAILKSLLNIRKITPSNYQNENLNYDGLCRLRDFPKTQVTFVASLLLEDGLIETFQKEPVRLQTGDIYITTKGIEYLKRIEKGSASVRGEKNRTIEYDIAISFAGEDRALAEELANELIAKGLKAFYDRFEEANLWGKNLYEYFSDIYINKARFCAMFLSKHYAEKAWTTLERRSAQERAFKERREYILPIRIDDTKIPGILDTIGYVSINDHSIKEIANLIEQKLKELEKR